MEFAIGIPDPEKPFPVPRNPWDVQTWPGGSSSGTGSGIAAGMFLGGLGTDTGGSIRMPAAYCGISGLKPTFGRVPKYGCVPLGYSYDNIGPMARSAYDCAVMLRALAGHDARDACSVDLPVPDYPAELTGSLAGVRIGVDLLEAEAVGLTDPALAGAMQTALAVLADAGAVVKPVTIPLYRELKEANRIGRTAEAFAYHRHDLATRWSDYGADTRLALGAGALVSGADYVQSQRVRRVGQRLIAELLTEVDLIVTPTAAGGALRFDELSAETFGASMHTRIWNAVGNPALAVPVGFTDGGLPLSMQIVGRPFEETTVLNAGHAYQQRTAWHLEVSPLVLAEAPVSA
jgi:aspartyl-tRNA(Asn)/glutamyl-tRNA(Gln) amidotransferase subunit A